MTSSTSVPNHVLDKYLPELNGVELKLLLVIIRQTLGWWDKKSNAPKQRDWISGSQLKQKTGCSSKAIGSATQSLINKNLIEVTNDKGFHLRTPEDRRGISHLYYRPTSAIFSHVENEGISCPTSVFIAEDIRNNVAALTQKIRTTI
jgi:biotin operon repressor